MYEGTFHIDDLPALLGKAGQDVIRLIRRAQHDRRAGVYVHTDVPPKQFVIKGGEMLIVLVDGTIKEVIKPDWFRSVKEFTVLAPGTIVIHSGNGATVRGVHVYQF